MNGSPFIHLRSSKYGLSILALRRRSSSTICRSRDSSSSSAAVSLTVTSRGTRTSHDRGEMARCTVPATDDPVDAPYNGTRIEFHRRLRIFEFPEDPAAGVLGAPLGPTDSVGEHDGVVLRRPVLRPPACDRRGAVLGDLPVEVRQDPLEPFRLRSHQREDHYDVPAHPDDAGGDEHRNAEPALSPPLAKATAATCSGLGTPRAWRQLCSIAGASSGAGAAVVLSYVGAAARRARHLS